MRTRGRFASNSYPAMRKALSVACVLAAMTATSEARHWRWHWHGNHSGAPYNSIEKYGSAREDIAERKRWRRDVNPTDLVPPGWQLQAPEANWSGKRFVSPDGSSWLAVYSFPTTKEAVALHMQSVAFAEGETLTFLRGEKDWIAVSGVKSERIFYSKAIIACGGKVWHQIAFEYPIVLKREMDPLVARAGAIIDLAQSDGCETDTSSTN